MDKNLYIIQIQKKEIKYAEIYNAGKESSDKFLEYNNIIHQKKENFISSIKIMT